MNVPKPGTPWNLPELHRPPECWAVPERDDGPIRAILYEGLPYRGRPTRVFAYCALPEVVPAAGVPGIVLAHGGGGTAFRDWAREWADRGYAAIAMDPEGRPSEG